MKERIVVWIVAWVTLATALIRVVTFGLVSVRWDESLAECFMGKGWTPRFVSQLENA